MMVARIAVMFGLLWIQGVAVAGPLFDAAGRGDSFIVQELLNDGVAVDERGRNAETPLIAAALAGQIGVARILIDQGADIMARNKGGFTPLHAAAYSGNAGAARLLLDNGAKHSDQENVSGATPLIVAAEENNVAVAELLIERGADLGIADRDGFTALTQAWAKRRTEMVRLLKQHGAICQPVEVLGTEDYYRRCVSAGK